MTHVLTQNSWNPGQTSSSCVKHVRYLFDLEIVCGLSHAAYRIICSMALRLRSRELHTLVLCMAGGDYLKWKTNRYCHIPGILFVFHLKWRPNVTYPVYMPRMLPLGRSTVEKTPHLHFTILKTSMGHFQGHWATWDQHPSSQEQFWLFFSWLNCSNIACSSSSGGSEMHKK